MSEFVVLDARVPSERERWLGVWNAWPHREISAHPDYVRLFARDVDRPACAVWAAADGGVLYPFILRPLSVEPWASGDPSSDVTSAYGYGGAYRWGSADVAEAFWTAFERWAAAHRVVASFARLSLFRDEQVPFKGVVADDRTNIVRTLDLDEEALLRDYEHKVRKNVKRATANGLRVEVDTTGARLDDFLAIYESTLDRRQASDAYYFDRSFFQEIVGKLPNGFAFFHVLAAERVVSTELVLVSATHLYSFLGGTLSDAFSLRPNDLLKHEVALWGRAQGKAAYVLGGGYAPDDGILRYKRSFAPHGEVTFFVGRWTHDAAACDALVDRRRSWEAGRGVEWAPRPGFFPPYR